MTDTRERIRVALDHAVESRTETGDWSRVLADAERGSRARWTVRAAVAAAAVLGIALAVLLVPFEDDRPVGVIDRALAAIGDGPVVHLVTRGEWGGHLVDVESGEVTALYGETEIWYDADRGLHYLSRYGDHVSHDVLLPQGRHVERQGADLVALANRYRDELAARKAKVVGEGRVGNREVLWIRVRSRWYPDVADGRNHLFAEEVAVDRETYEPVYMRSTRDGRAAPGGGQAILELETLEKGEGDFTAAETRAQGEGMYGRFGLGRQLTRTELASQLGSKALWLGRDHDGKPLVEAKVAEFGSRKEPDEEWDIVEGVSLFYGFLKPRRGGIRIRDDDKPFVQVLQATELSPMWRGAQFAGELPAGTVLFEPSGAVFLKRDGVHVSVSSRDRRDALEAALALRRVGEPQPDRSHLDLDAILARTQKLQPVPVEGGARVRPRPLVPRRGRRIASATARGVRVDVFANGAARFDTRAMPRALQRPLPDELTARCFRVRGDTAGSGAGGPIPKNGVRDVVTLGQPQRGRVPIIRGPFDACEIGAGFGRNWLPRFDWHWPFEFPLNERGRRFFEERAAALELAHFVRNGSRKRARRAMRRGAPAPPAARLRDPARPYISVTATGTTFTASMRASTGRRFFVEIRRGRIGRSNAERLAFVR